MNWQITYVYLSGNILEDRIECFIELRKHTIQEVLEFIRLHPKLIDMVEIKIIEITE